jgi:hypothetical protein
MFEIVIPPTVDGSTAGSGGTGNAAQTKSELISRRITEGSQRKILLPRRAGEPRFGPQPYYYEASPTGVVPAEMAPSEHRTA